MQLQHKSADKNFRKKQRCKFETLCINGGTFLEYFKE